MSTKLTVKVEVYPFDESTGQRSGTSSAGKPYSFFTQSGVLDAGPAVPPVVFKIQHSNRSEVLAPGWYDADLMPFVDRYQSLQVRAVNFRSVAGKPQVVAS